MGLASVHIFWMDEAHKTVRLVPRLHKDRSVWQIDVCYLDGKVETIVGFESEAEANTWIETTGKPWLRTRMLASHRPTHIIDIGVTEANKRPRSNRRYIKKLDPMKRAELAKKAAMARWDKSHHSSHS
jgi:hypothetical protein